MGADGSWRAWTAAAAGRRCEIPVQGRSHAAGCRPVSLHPGPVSGAGPGPDHHCPDSLWPAEPYLDGRADFCGLNTGIGLMFVFAITSIGVYGVTLAGWSSNSKYPLMGGLRSSAQMISYEVSLTLSVVGVVLLANTLNFNTMIEGQLGYYLHFIPRWNIVPQIIGFLCYFTSAVAETNRVPFDLPEAETELVAGFHTEYSSFKFAMFFMAEYANMITVSSLATILFLGGWLSPF